MSRLRHLALIVMIIIASVCAIERSARADRRAEAAAKTALKKAEDDHLRMEFDKGLKRLQVAERGCGETGCSTATHAALLRDIGVMELRLGLRDAALASFLRAKKLDNTIALNPSYDAPDLRQAWAASTPAARPAGDFTHTPAAEQSARTPIPVYVEPLTSEMLTSVVVKYKNESMRAFRRAVLKSHGGGVGWGGYIPCADVIPGTMSYYLQGFDKDSELVASSGDPKHTFTVVVKESIAGDGPSLPGERPPRTCTDEDVETLNLADGERCHEDRHCKSGVCSAERCRSVDREPIESAGPREHAHLWIGVSGSLDLTITPASTGVCRLSGGVSTTGYWCTTPDGASYPSSDTLVNESAGTTTSDITTSGVHVVATIDYAATASLLIGVRVGFVAASYPGSAASSAGKTLGFPLHAELRGTYLLGDEPLTRPGLAPYIFAAGGVARADTSATVMVRERNVVGERAVQAWRVAGPGFGALGGGARYAFSVRTAFLAGLKITTALGPGGFAPSVGPELQFQYGF